MQTSTSRMQHTADPRPLSATHHHVDVIAQAVESGDELTEATMMSASAFTWALRVRADETLHVFAAETARLDECALHELADALLGHGWPATGRLTGELTRRVATLTRHEQQLALMRARELRQFAVYERTGRPADAIGLTLRVLPDADLENLAVLADCLTLN